MILNAHTDLRDLRAGKPRPAKARPKRVREIAAEALDELPVTEVRPDPEGSFEQKCAWMRARMARKRQKKGNR